MIKDFFRTIARIFLKSCAVFIGFSLFIFVVAAIIGSMILEQTDSDKLSFKTQYKPVILENSEGVREVLSDKSPIVLSLNISGEIGSKFLNQEVITKQLIESREGVFEEGRVKALFLMINTPGGTVTDSDGIYRAIKAYKKRYDVPVYAYVNGLCASGGMYVASAADKVFASDVSIIGSVGVALSPFINVSKLLDKLGIESQTITSGTGKDAMNPLRPWKENEDANLEAISKYYYGQFLDIVTEARPRLDRALLIETYGAHIFPAEEAQKIGMIDVSGVSRNEALDALVKEINEEVNNVQIVGFGTGSWIDELFQEKSFFSSQITHKVKIPGALPEELSGKWLYMAKPFSGVNR